MILSLMSRGLLLFCDNRSVLRSQEEFNNVMTPFISSFHSNQNESTPHTTRLTD
jgi:hypothetical protein